MDHLRDNQAFDAFGETLPAFSPRTNVGRRARLAGIAVFWSLALLIIAGRVHYAPNPLSTPIELAAR